MAQGPLAYASLFGLSKERPILDHHPKAQSEMPALFVKSGAFREKQCFSYEKWHFS